MKLFSVLMTSLLMMSWRSVRHRCPRQGDGVHRGDARMKRLWWRIHRVVVLLAFWALYISPKYLVEFSLWAYKIESIRVKMPEKCGYESVFERLFLEPNLYLSCWLSCWRNTFELASYLCDLLPFSVVNVSFWARREDVK